MFTNCYIPFIKFYIALQAVSTMHESFKKNPPSYNWESPQKESNWFHFMGGN